MAVPPPLFSVLYMDGGTKWDETAPNYGALITLMGSTPGTAHGAPAIYSCNKVTFGLTNLATHLATLITFCPDSDNELQ